MHDCHRNLFYGESIDIALSLVSPAIFHLNATYSFDLVGVNLIGLAENGCCALRVLGDCW